MTDGKAIVKTRCAFSFALFIRHEKWEQADEGTQCTWKLVSFSQLDLTQLVYLHLGSAIQSDGKEVKRELSVHY